MAGNGSSIGLMKGACLMIYKKSFFILLVATTVLLPGRHPAHAGFATEGTQILNNLELMGLNVTQIQAIAQQADQLLNEATMIENQYKNLLTLGNDPLALINALNQLSNIVQQGQILSYAAANVDSQYANLYPGYAVYRNQDMSTAVLQQKYQDWSNQNQDNIKAALKAAGVHEETLQNEKGRLDTVVDLSKTAEGRLQAIQAGNLIAAEEVASLQRLRQLVMTNTQLQANYQAKEQDKEDVNAAKWEQVTAGATTNIHDGESILNDSF